MPALVLEQPPAVGGHDQPERHLVAGQHLEEPDAVRGTGGAADGEGDRERAHSPAAVGSRGADGMLEGSRERGAGSRNVPRHLSASAPLADQAPPAPCSLLPAPALHTSRSSRANPNTVTLITPFIVKNAASSRERSPGRTSWCSQARIAAAADDARHRTRARIRRHSRTAPARESWRRGAAWRGGCCSRSPSRTTALRSPSVRSKCSSGQGVEDVEAGDPGGDGEW